MMTCLCLSVIHRGNVKQRQCYVPCLATMWTKRNNISIHITLSGTWRQFNTFDRLNAACSFPLLPLGAVLRFSGRRCDARGRFRSIFFFFFVFKLLLLSQNGGTFYHNSVPNRCALFTYQFLL